MTNFFNSLEEHAKKINSLLCVGLDPHYELLKEKTVNGVQDFCYKIIDELSPLALAFKPNCAFFEYLGERGIKVLKNVIKRIPNNIPIILDAKRIDIESTSKYYASAAFEELGVDAITVNPFLGYDSLLPFLKYSEKGIFILCKTSNPGSHIFQNKIITTEDNITMPLFQYVAKMAQSWNTSNNIGLVVGGTDIQALKTIRTECPDMWILTPGFGTQGGNLNDILENGLRHDKMGLLLNSSRTLAQYKNKYIQTKKICLSINKERFKESTMDNIARELFFSKCVNFGQFTLKSGKTSPIYLDLRKLCSRPRSLENLARYLSLYLQKLKFDHIVGIPYAALPICTMASSILNCSMIYLRKEIKTYGTKNAIEGIYSHGDIGILVDDLATTGETKFETIDNLEKHGIIIKDIVVIVDREQGAKQTLENAGYDFHALITISQLLSSLEKQSLISKEQKNIVETYLQNEH